MTDPRVQQYIDVARSQGMSDPEIKAALIQGGWQEAQVQEAFGERSTNVSSHTPPPPPQQETGAVVQPMASQSETFFDSRTIQITIWSIIGFAIFQITGYVAMRLSVSFLFRDLGFWGPFVSQSYGFGFGISAEIIVGLIVVSVLFGGLIGIVLSKWGKQILDFVSTQTGGRIGTTFKLVFYPIVAWIAIDTFLSMGVWNYGLTALSVLLITALGELIGGFIYSKIVSGQVTLR